MITSGKPPTKTELIIELLKAGQDNDHTIADKVGSTVSFVRKVKCNNKSELTDSRRLERDGNHEQSEPKQTFADISKDQKEQEKQKSPNQQNRVSTDRPSLMIDYFSPEDRKILWKEFLKGTPLAEIIATYGYHPMAVGYEYQEFLKLNGMEVPKMQEMIFRELSQSMNDISLLEQYDIQEYKRLSNEFQRKGYLDSRQHNLLFEIFGKTKYLKGKYSILNESEEPPEPLKRPTCGKCGEYIPRVIADPETGYGKKVFQIRWDLEHQCDRVF